MNAQKRVMLLIDADNVSADVIDQAVDHVKALHGAIHVRRAYCTAESALANLQLFKRHSIRPIVNLSTGKNSTDISLAVDAVDLVLAERPDIVVIVSSDSDFAPLVIRLREKGCRVEGVGQLGKTGEDSKPVYDDFIDLTHHKARASAVPRAAPRKRAAPRPAEAAAAAAATAAAPALAPARSAARMAEPAQRRPPPSAAAERARAPAPAPASAPVAARAPATSRPVSLLPDDVARILAAVPELWRGGKLELGIAAEQLRTEKLLARSATSTRLFKKYPAHFALTPERQPNKVQYVGPRVV
jgi:uncharacterized protein (TIGR00288 family)